jgi:uncharacterized protein (DUF427 family)
MKIRIPTNYKKIKINKSDQFIAKSKKHVIMVELPKPVNKWWIDGYYIDEKFTEITLVDAVE